MPVSVIGQDKLLSKINNYTYETLPKTMLFLGETGCGKHHLSKYIADKFGFDLAELTESINSDNLIEFAQRTIPTLYIINIANFTEKQQNQFLKFIEEPADSVYISLLANSEVGVLPTILNRCIKFVFDDYTVEQLKAFTWLANSDNELFYKICRTPGKLSAIDDKSFNNLVMLCNAVITKITTANYANTLSLATKLNCKKDTFDRFDVDLFFDTLKYLAFEDFKNNNNLVSFKIYSLTSEAQQKKVGNLKLDAFMYNYFIRLWKETRA